MDIRLHERYPLSRCRGIEDSAA